MERQALARVCAIPDPAGAGDPAYTAGLHGAVAAALDYGLAAAEEPSDRFSPVPVALLAQARLAARNEVALDTVLRRYAAGHSLLVDFLVERVEQEGLSPAKLKLALRALSIRFDRLIATVSEEYRRESDSRRAGRGQRRTQLIESLLRGELIDTSEIPYDFDGYHLGLVISGKADPQRLRHLAGSLDCRLLLVEPRGQTAWAWLGGRRRIDLDDRKLESHLVTGSSLACGELGEGLAGWRLTHRQAVAAMPVAQRGIGSVVRYRDVALLASILQDELLATSLHQMFLAPLELARDGGSTARDTLRAYFATGRNVSSTAAALQVNRNTVASRLQRIEERVGQPLSSRAPEFEAALRLASLLRPQC